MQTTGQSNRTNFSFGPQGTNSFTPEKNMAGPGQSYRSPMEQFEISYGGQHPGTEVRKQLEQLDQGGFKCYRIFVAVMGVIEGILTLINLVGLFVPMSQDEVVGYMGGTLLMGWNTYQLYAEYRAISQKSFAYARKAVTLMKWYMGILAVLLAVGAGGFFFMEAPVAKDISTEMYVLSVVLTIVLAEGVFYFLFFYGALKVRDLLTEPEVVEENTYAPLPDY